MKNRTVTLAFIACVASLLSFADNPADAPLVPDDRNATIMKQQTHKDRNGNKDRNGQQQNNNDVPVSSKRNEKGRGHAAQAGPDGQPGNPEFSNN